MDTKVAGYTYKHKKTGKNVTVKSYTIKVLKFLAKQTNRDKVSRVEKQVPLLEKAVWEYCQNT